MKLVDMREEREERQQNVKKTSRRSLKSKTSDLDFTMRFSQGARCMPENLKLNFMLFSASSSERPITTSSTSRERKRKQKSICNIKHKHFLLAWDCISGCYLCSSSCDAQVMLFNAFDGDSQAVEGFLYAH